MGTCTICNKQIKLKNNKFYCDGCGEQITYKCWNCKTEIDPEKIKPIYKNEKECSWCGFFVCPNCNKCGKKKKKNDFIECERTQLHQTVIDRYKFDGVKTSIMQGAQILGNVVSGKVKRYCVRNVPYSYAHGRNKDYFLRMVGWKSKGDTDTQLFKDRYDKIITEPVGTTWTVSDKREDGTHGQEVRDACNLGVCMGQIQIKKNETNSLVYERFDNGVCEKWNSNKILRKKCPKCKEIFDEDYESDICDCIWSKGDKVGQHVKLVPIRTNVTTCLLPGLEFKTEVK